MILLNKCLINNNFFRDVKSFEETYIAYVKDFYYKNKIFCPACKSRTPVLDGFYERNLQIEDQVEKISVQRVYCPICEKTHAVFTTDFIPYCFWNAKDAFDFFQKKQINIKMEELVKLFLRNMWRRVKLKKEHYLHLLQEKLEKLDLIFLQTKLTELESMSFLQIHRGSIMLNISPQ